MVTLASMAELLLSSEEILSVKVKYDQNPVPMILKLVIITNIQVPKSPGLTMNLTPFPVPPSISILGRPKLALRAELVQRCCQVHVLVL